MSNIIERETIDITPTPRILRVLGDIPFMSWQCLAELIDNSIDAFAAAEKSGNDIEAPRIDVYWSNENIAMKDREITIQDNGPGMSLSSLQAAAKAGYSSNDAIHNLGLFGMGFNIATARMGDETHFLSATKDSTEWVGIQINFKTLIKGKTFDAAVLRIPKTDPSEHGTKVVIRSLKEGIYHEVKKKESTVRKQLEIIYTPILGKGDVQILVQGKQLLSRPHCVWGESRYVIRRQSKVEAVQQIDRDLEESYFDNLNNRYLSDDESDELEIKASKGEELPTHITKRSRRLKGWIGIQRHFDPNDFGIDFIRNGRKILVKDKSLFSFDNPETGTAITEYPVELGSTVGGRIVGELHVDYLIPTYQKNGFDTTDRAWRLTVEAVRGSGPILPRSRSSLGYDGDNDSALGKLVNAYRRTEPGTKNLAIARDSAKQFFKRFWDKDPEYQSDDRWYKVAQEADRNLGEGKSGTPVNPGESPSDDIDSYLGDDSTPPIPTPSATATPVVAPQDLSSSKDQLILQSEKELGLTGKFSHTGNRPIDVSSYRVKNAQIKSDGKRVPYISFMDGVAMDFFYDPTHIIFTEYPISPRQILLFSLAERFKNRDNVTIHNALIGLIENHLTDERINYQALAERASGLVVMVKEQLPAILGHRFQSVKAVIAEVEYDEEELIRRLTEDSQNLILEYQSNGERAAKCLPFVGESLLKRLINKFPEEFMDGKVFDLPYATLTVGSEASRDRLKQNSLQVLMRYLNDVTDLLQPANARLNKYELLRYANTLVLFENLIVDRT